MSLLTRLDMSDEANRKDAAHRLLRAKTDAELAAWAREYGEALCSGDIENAVTVAEGERDKAYDDATKAEENLADIQEAAETLITLLDKVEDWTPPDNIQNAIGRLEGFL